MQATLAYIFSHTQFSFFGTALTYVRRLRIYAVRSFLKKEAQEDTKFPQPYTYS
jgi:hypothetical protein